MAMRKWLVRFMRMPRIAGDYSRPPAARRGIGPAESGAASPGSASWACTTAPPPDDHESRRAIGPVRAVVEAVEPDERHPAAEAKPHPRERHRLVQKLDVVGRAEDPSPGAGGGFAGPQALPATARPRLATQWREPRSNASCMPRRTWCIASAAFRACLGGLRPCLGRLRACLGEPRRRPDTRWNQSRAQSRGARPLHDLPPRVPARISARSTVRESTLTRIRPVGSAGLREGGRRRSRADRPAR